jgi:hypothetical protein
MQESSLKPFSNWDFCLLLKGVPVLKSWQQHLSGVPRSRIAGRSGYEHGIEIQKGCRSDHPVRGRSGSGDPGLCPRRLLAEPAESEETASATT